jgi:hypothetical protein
LRAIFETLGKRIADCYLETGLKDDACDNFQREINFRPSSNNFETRYNDNTKQDMDDAEMQAGQADTTVTEFDTFEDYLDSQITAMDMYYLEVSL